MPHCYVGYDSNRVLGGPTSVNHIPRPTRLESYPTQNQPRLSGGALGSGGSGGIGLFPLLS